MENPPYFDFDLRLDSGEHGDPAWPVGRIVAQQKHAPAQRTIIADKVEHSAARQHLGGVLRRPDEAAPAGQARGHCCRFATSKNSGGAMIRRQKMYRLRR